MNPFYLLIYILTLLKISKLNPEFLIIYSELTYPLLNHLIFDIPFLHKIPFEWMFTFFV